VFKIQDPVFGKLDALIAGAMMGIGAVKGVAIGDGFAVAERFGSENNDPMTGDGFASNHAGGILGGISSGQDIVVRIAVKPTPSITKMQKTRDIHGNIVDISVGGRHDPCIVPRILPVAEAMLALVLADCLLEQGKYR
jgi:chorismate synthase